MKTSLTPPMPEPEPTEWTAENYRPRYRQAITSVRDVMLAPIAKTAQAVRPRLR